MLLPFVSLHEGMLRPPSCSHTATASASIGPLYLPLSSPRTPPRRRSSTACSLPVALQPPAACRLPPPSRSACPLRCTTSDEKEGRPVDFDVEGTVVEGRDAEGEGHRQQQQQLGVALGTSPSLATRAGDRGLMLFSFVALTMSFAFTSMVVAAVPALLAMRKTAISLAKLADTAREELPSTMAAIRLSGMEISDLTVELSDLSQEIADGVTKSAQAVQAAEAGVRQIGALARQKTMSMIEERANLPDITIEPVVAGATRKTAHVVGQVKKIIMNIIFRGGTDI